MKTHANYLWILLAAESLLGLHILNAQTELTTGQLTIQQSARIGSLIDEAGGPGFTMDVLQTQYETETVVTVYPPPIETQEYQEIWGNIDMGYYSEVWQTHQVEYYQDATYDESGNVLDPGGSYWVDETYLAYSQWMEQWQWGVVGHDNVTVWIEQDPYEEVQYATNYNHPVVRFTGSRSNTEWLWRNPAAAGSHRPLMKLGMAGLSFPQPFEVDYDRKSLLNYYQVLYSKSNLTDDDAQRVSQGSRVTDEGVSVWHDKAGIPGAESRLQNPVWSSEVRLKSSTLEIQRNQPQANGSPSQVITAVSADFATFGGGASFAREVSFHGAVRIQPRGDLSMGAFTQGPQPE